MRPLLALALAACSSASHRTPAAPPVVRVLVYNIHAGKDAAGVDNLERVADVVKSSGADLVLLQEVDKHTKRSGDVDQPAVLSRLTGLAAAFGKTLDYQDGDYGIAVLSRWPIHGDTLVRLRVEPPQDRSGRYEPRGALRLTIASPWGPLAVVTTHIDASGDDRWRRQEVPTLLAVADSIKKRGTMLLFGGDMNSTPESAVQGMVRAAGLRDAWTECGRGQELTYPADVPVKRIDYLYLSGQSRCDEARVLDTQASDHRPVLFVVRLR
jgi:endonuclease/exonuclease/phosphatase family metal-dependent hydrolase